ncbi:MAG TPA: hypothetical protein VEU62_08640 [Bryobacterales bacterium]|nr:hypothetical protein [Bryobacterales bacterium]
MADNYVTKEYLDQSLEGLEERIDAKMETLGNKLMEFARDLQSELLRGFEGFTRRVDVRLANLEVNGANDTLALKQRLAEVETRLLEIEKKLLQRPPAA